MDGLGIGALEAGWSSFLACKRTYMFLKPYLFISTMNAVEIEHFDTTLYSYLISSFISNEKLKTIYILQYSLFLRNHMLSI